MRARGPELSLGLADVRSTGKNRAARFVIRKGSRTAQLWGLDSRENGPLTGASAGTTMAGNELIEVCAER